jgi:hypothetical protein
MSRLPPEFELSVRSGPAGALPVLGGGLREAAEDTSQSASTNALSEQPGIVLVVMVSACMSSAAAIARCSWTSCSRVCSWAWYSGSVLSCSRTSFCRGRYDVSLRSVDQGSSILQWIGTAMGPGLKKVNRVWTDAYVCIKRRHSDSSHSGCIADICVGADYSCYLSHHFIQWQEALLTRVLVGSYGVIAHGHCRH